MNRELFSDAMNEIDSKYVEEALTYKPAKRFVFCFGKAYAGHKKSEGEHRQCCGNDAFHIPFPPLHRLHDKENEQ